jgi:hypothetical protein
MKIILSRKGFDSANGGGPSPIFPDGRMLSLPIPASSSPTRFADCRWGEQNVGRLVESLTSGRVSTEHPAHLDPDLDHGVRPREAGWRPAFGQTGAAQTHLAQHGIGAGDLFLFFGWFREAELAAGGTWRFTRGAPDLHVLFGWLQVGELLRVADQGHRYGEHYPWLRDHPHLNGTWSDANTVYIAAETMNVFNDERFSRLPGGGTFSGFSQSRVLTAPQQAGRSFWRLPGWFYPANGELTFSYHDKPERWSRGPDGSAHLRSVARGQEFVLATNRDADVSNWLSDIFS